MKAVVLVGGEGTRMRPLTETVPKPLLPMVDRPFLDHVLDRLAAHGVDEVILSSPYLEEVFDPFLQSIIGKQNFLDLLKLPLLFFEFSFFGTKHFLFQLFEVF